MISVQSRHLPLNGSSFHIFILLAILILSCSTTKPVSKNDNNIPQKKSEVLVDKSDTPSKVDTIRWKEQKKIESPDIKKENTNTKTNEKAKPSLLSSYNIVGLLPFKSTELDTNSFKLPSGSLRFIQYYAGMKMAIDELKTHSGPIINVYINDSGADEKGEDLIQKLSSQSPHLIIGPYKTEALKAVAGYAKENKISMISPWISSPNIGEKNPFYIQTKAGLNAHYHLINQHVRQNFPLANVYLVSKSTQESKAKNFNDSIKYAVQITEKIIAENDLATSTTPVITPLLKENAVTVFILPLASNKDENYIYHFLRRVNTEKEGKQVIIYGLSKWLEMKSDIVDFINAMNVRMTASNFIDSDGSDVRSFKKKFFEEFREFPSQEAMEGYDLMKYCIQMLRSQGKDFQFNGIVQTHTNFLETQFYLKPVFKNTSNTDIYSADYFENTYIKLVELKANKFRIIE